MLCKIMAMALGNCHIMHWNDRNLTEFPEDLIQFKNQVNQIYLKNNFIEALPKWIDSLVTLTHIYMDNNKLSSFPEELSQLKSLEVLCAPGNCITDIPPELSSLKRLTQLNLSRNRIKSVPYEMFNMRSLWLLDLSYNEIEMLPKIYPEELYLGEILLNHNKLICVPDNLAQLKNLEYLSLTHNKLLYIPAVIFRTETIIKVDHNPFLNYMPINTKAENCGNQKFQEAHMLPNVALICSNHNLIISPKIKEVFRVHENSHYPSLKEFALRIMYVWKIPIFKNRIPKNLYEQLTSGPAATCMQCLRPMFTYSFICLFYHESHAHFDAQYFCSKSCHGAFKQLIKICCLNQMGLKEMDFKIKPYGFLTSLL